jgi:hypothetical protein
LKKEKLPSKMKCSICGKDIFAHDQMHLSKTHQDTFFCTSCFTIFEFVRGLSIDLNIDMMEQAIIKRPYIQFDRGLDKVN